MSKASEMTNCRKCAGEDFPHHATTCELRGQDLGDQKKPGVKVDPDTLVDCIYCGEKVTRADFLSGHSLGTCGS